MTKKKRDRNCFSTYFICFTMVLFPDSPAPEERRKQFEWQRMLSILTIFYWIATFCFKSGVTSSSQPFLPYCLSFRDLYMLHSIFMTYSLSARRLAMSTDESKFCNIMQHIWRTEAVCTCAYTEGFCTSFTPGDDFILILLTEAVPKHLLSKLGFLLT